VRRGEHRIAAAGDIGTAGSDRDDFLAQVDSRQGFDFEIHDAIHLFPRKIPYLGLTKIYIFDFGGGQTLSGGRDFIF
jgi:hypothetical protein